MKFAGFPGDSAISLVRKTGSANIPSNCFNDCFPCRQKKKKKTKTPDLQLFPLQLVNELLMRQRCRTNVVWKLKRIKPRATGSEYQTEVLNKSVSRLRAFRLAGETGIARSVLTATAQTKHTSSSVTSRLNLHSPCHPSYIYISSALRLFESFLRLLCLFLRTCSKF